MTDTPSRRGRPPRTTPVEPTGYRCTADTRLELQVAIAFLGERTLQAVIDRAVAGFLETMRSEVDGFTAAVEAARPAATEAAADALPPEPA